MRYIFTLLLFICVHAQAQFNEVVYRILFERPVEIKFGVVRCGLCMGTSGFIDNPIVDIPPVRRSLEGLDLPLISRKNVPPTDTAKKTSFSSNPEKQCKIIMRCRSDIWSNDPLLVVDGVPLDSFSYLQQIPLCEIEEINILKDAAASAIYGYRAARGVLIVTTKSASQRTIKILDEEDRQPIPRATVRFISVDKSDTLQISADDSGYISVSNLNWNKRYEVNISSAGYHSKTKKINWQDIASKGEEWLLLRNLIIAPEVILFYTNCGRKRVTSCCFLGRTRCEKHRVMSATEKKETKAFPNPARPGQTVTIEQDVEAAEKVSLQIFNAAGTAMGVWNKPATNGLNQFRFTTGQHWASGTYFFRILYANGRVAASGQIIIQ